MTKIEMTMTKTTMTKIETTMTKIEMTMTKTETTMTKIEMTITKIELTKFVSLTALKSIPKGFCIVIVESLTFSIHHLIVFLFFSIIQFSFSLISTYFLRVRHCYGCLRGV